MPAANLVTCSRCQQKVPISEMKYNLDGKSLICGFCAERVFSKEKKKESSAETKRSQPKILRFAGEKMKYTCLDCRYKFSLREDSSVNLKCPYCNSNRIIEDRMIMEQLFADPVSSISNQ